MQNHAGREERHKRRRRHRNPTKRHNAGVDHIHGTNIVRGLLCRKCNLALGLFGEELNTLRKAIEYLEFKGN